MEARKYVRSMVTVCALLSVLLGATRVRAELKPNDVLNQSNWQEAKGLMPDAVLRRFELGQHLSKVIELPKEELRWGSRFNEATEKNQGIYEINSHGILIEKATGTWPRFGYGLPFTHIDPNDPQAVYKIMYNFFRTLVQWDDINVFINFFWTTPQGLDRYVDFRGQALNYGSRWSGPVPNPEEVFAKVLLYGVAPYDVVGLATLDWNYLDPEKWRSVWSFVPVIRRVRRLNSADSSTGVFGSHISRDDFATFANRIHYFEWKLIGVKDALVPYTLPVPKVWELAQPQGFVLPANENAAIMPWPGQSKFFTEQQWTGAAWWPTNLYLTQRPVWVLELTPKDPYYAYGRQILWVDKELFFGYYKEIYDRAGEYWKTIIRGGGIALNKEKTFSTTQTDFLMALDERSNMATVTLPLREGNDIKVKPARKSVGGRRESQLFAQWVDAKPTPVPRHIAQDS